MNRTSKSVVLRSLDTLTKRATTSAGKVKGAPRTLTVGFFDFCGSSELKHRRGHERAIEEIFRFTSLASTVVKELHGNVVKELGDGLLCSFEDPFDACRAVLNLKLACRDSGLIGRFGLTIGRVSVYSKPEGRIDVLGDAVDRCARIQSFCSPGQFLVDEPFFKVVKTHLIEWPEIRSGKEFHVEAKGVGRLDLYEVSLEGIGLVDRITTPFCFYGDGRRSIEEKVQFISQGESEVLEIGIGLSSFAMYFKGQKPNEWRNHIRKLIRHWA